MKKSNASSIPNLIGILLVIVALVSAGGLYYTASTYTRISETYVSVWSEISDVSVVFDNASEEVEVTVSVLVNNPSSLDIEIYRVEYMCYMDKDPSSLSNYNRYIGSGSSSEKNNTVRAGSERVVEVSFKVDSENTYYDRVLYAMEDGPSVYFMVDGNVWFSLASYSQVQNQVGIYSTDLIEVRNV